MVFCGEGRVGVVHRVREDECVGFSLVEGVKPALAGGGGVFCVFLWFVSFFSITCFFFLGPGIEVRSLVIMSVVLQ